MDFKGKNVAIVGGFGGIGFETCKCFLQKGIAKLAIFDLKENSAALGEIKAKYSGAEIIFLPLDITRKDNIEQCFRDVVAQFKHLDIVVNSSGVVADHDPKLTLDVNLLGLINSTLTAFNYMDKTKGGKGGLIVNVASVLGLEPCPPISIYSASKHGVIGFTRSLADDFYYQRTGIKLIAICPGVTDSNLTITFQGRTTFPYVQELADKFLTYKQSAAECAVNLLKAVEQNKNGSIWICDHGKLQEVNPTKYWVGEL